MADVATATPIERRLIDKEAVKAYLDGISDATLSRWIRRGLVPGPVPGTQKWDKRHIDAVLDEIGGLSSIEDQDKNELDEAFGFEKRGTPA